MPCRHTTGAEMLTHLPPGREHALPREEESSPELVVTVPLIGSTGHQIGIL